MSRYLFDFRQTLPDDQDKAVKLNTFLNKLVEDNQEELSEEKYPRGNFIGIINGKTGMGYTINEGISTEIKAIIEQELTALFPK